MDFLPEILFLGVFVVDSGDCSDDLCILANSTAERSELLPFVCSLAPPQSILRQVSPWYPLVCRREAEAEAERRR